MYVMMGNVGGYNQTYSESSSLRALLRVAESIRISSTSTKSVLEFKTITHTFASGPLLGGGFFALRSFLESMVFLTLAFVLLKDLSLNVISKTVNYEDTVILSYPLKFFKLVIRFVRGFVSASLQPNDELKKNFTQEQERSAPFAKSR